MKTIITTLTLLITGISLSQGSADTTRFKIGTIEFIIVDNDTIPVGDSGNEVTDDDGEHWGEIVMWGGIDVGINLPLNEQQKPEYNSAHLQTDPAESFSYSINFGETRIKLIKHYFGLVTGFSFTNSRYGFKDDYLRLGANVDSTWGYKDTTLASGFNKNQLRVNYLSMPFLFQFNTSKKEENNFYFSFGAIAGVRIGAKVKYEYEVLGGENKHKEKGVYNLNPFQLCGTVRLGYNHFGLFANYNILSLYEKDKSEIAYPLTFGASFHF